MKITKTGAALLIVFVLLLLAAAVPLTVSNFTQVHIDKMPQGGTGTPRLMSDNKGGPSQIAVFKDAGTPVWSLNDGGAIVYIGDQTATGNFTVTNNSTFGDAADDTVTINGDMILNGIPDTDTANYNQWFKITGNATGTGTKDRNYPLEINMTRPPGQEIESGDHNEAGLKIRVDYEIVTTTVGTTLRAIDAEAKVDNPGGTVTNLYGASLTAKSDTAAGGVDRMIGLTVNAQNNAAVTTTLMSADFRLMRQAATVPTNEYGIQIRSSSTTGAGADAAIYVLSDYAGSLTTDQFGYGLDLSGSAVLTADIRLENGETISNQVDTAVQIGGFLALTEGAVLDLGATFTVNATASYQPITNSTGGSVTSSATTAIADGPTNTPAILIICNEDAQDMVLKDNANTLIGGDKTLTGGAQDCITLLWNGADWVGISVHDN